MNTRLQIIILTIFFSWVGNAQQQYIKAYFIGKELKRNQFDFFESFVHKKNNDDFRYFVLREINESEIESLKTKDFKNLSRRRRADDRLKHVSNREILKGKIKIDENIIFISPYKTQESKESSMNVAAINETDSKLYFYALQNGQKIRLHYLATAVNPVTIPMKWRFGGINNGQQIQEEFSFGINGVLHGGINFGSTKVVYNKGTGNEIDNFNLVLGPLVGFGAVTLNANNTFNNVIAEGDKFTKGIISTGFGITLSHNTLTFGVFYGRDYAIGQFAEDWFYNKEPWAGFGVGFNILK